MPGVQTEERRAALDEKADERIFDEVRRALQSGDGLIEMDEDVLRFFAKLQERIERGLKRKSEAYGAVDFSPFIKRLLDTVGEGRVL